MADLHGSTLFHIAPVRSQHSRRHMQQGRFARAVAAHDADAVIPEKVVGKVSDDGSAVIVLAHIVQFDDLAAQAAGGCSHLQGIVGFRRVLVFKCFVTFDAVFGFCGAGLAAPHDPFPLHTQDGLALAFAGFRHFRPLFLQFQIFRIIRFIMIDLTPGKLRNMVHNPFQEIPVMGNHHQTSPEGPEPVFQPGNHLAVQMVGGLIQHQNIRRMHQRGHQGHPLALTAGEGSHLLGKIRKAQLRQHGLGLIFIQFPEFRRKMQKYLLQNGSIVLHHGILRKKAHLDIGIAGNTASIRLQCPGQHFQKGGFTGTVDADDAHLIPFI